MRRLVVAAVVSLLASSSVALAVAPGFAPGKTTRVSTASDGTPANGPTQSPILSRDGRYAVFASSATDLASGATGVVEVYRHDRVTGATELVSVSTSGAPTAAGAFTPSVSGDGRFVAFASFGADLVNGDTNNALDVFVRDMTNGTTVAATTTASGAFTLSGGGLAGFPGARALSDDGRYVVFSSLASELVPVSNNGVAQVYVKDLATGAVVLASLEASGAAGNGASGQATISGDGHVVAFQSASTNLSPLATSGASQIYARDLVAGTTSLESVSTAGSPVTFFTAASPGLSYDGRYLVFETQAQLDLADLDGSWDVYLRDRAAATTTLASRSANTFFGVDSRGPAISSDGAYVAFHSIDPLLVTGDANNVSDVFLYGRDSGQLTLVSLNDDGVQANNTSAFPSLSADGTKVAFQSTATNLVPSPTSTGVQVYVRDLATDQAPVVSAGTDATVAEGVTFTRSGSFTDADGSTSWTATVDWGDGAGPQPLGLATDKTFTLTRLLGPGARTVTVAVTDGEGLTGSASFHLVVTNVAPTVNAGSGVELAFGTALNTTGSFTDPGTSEHYSATVDYGDGSGPGALVLASDRTFVLSHTYAAEAGSYIVAVAVSDDNGGTGTGSFTVTVRDDSYAWLSPTPTTANAGRTVPVRFTVTAPDGSFVLDQSVRVELLDANGTTVSGPYLWSTSTSTGVTASSGAYVVALDTTAVPPGDYTIRVSFASASLNGSFSRPLTLTDGSATAQHASR